jgi:serine/threonine protein kinase
MKTVGCPTGAVLTDFVLGKLPDEQMLQVADHARECAECQDQLHIADGLSDDLIAQIRHSPSADSGASAAALSQLLPRVEKIRTESADWTAGDAADDGTAHDVSLELKCLLAPPQGGDEIGRLGSYRVLKILGAGGMGIVLLAEDPQLQRFTALKVMKPSLASNPTARQRFLREAQATAQVRNDHVVTVYQVSEEGGAPFLAMELLEGETLQSCLSRADGTSGRPLLPLIEVLRIGQEIAAGLTAAHERGLIHRDIKPANIWLEKEHGRVKIVDFGLARLRDEDARLTQSGNVVGTPAYMSPEQANGQELDARSDLFSLGAVLYQLCTGVTPFRGASMFDTLLAVVSQVPTPIQELNARISPPLVDLVNRLLAKKPADRPESARVVMEALRQIQTQPVAAPPADPTLAVSSSKTMPVPDPSPRPAPRRALVAAMVVVAAAGGGIGLFLSSRPGEQPTQRDREVAQTTPAQPPTTAKSQVSDEEFNKRVAQLRGTQQIKAVSDRLKELNPEFPGIGPQKEGFAFTKPHPDGSYGIFKVTFPSDTVSDISPLAALTELKQVYVAGSKPGLGKVSDLRPLKDLKLVFLDITNTEVQDLSPLQGAAATLTHLYCKNTRVKNLTGLKELTELRELECDPPTQQADVLILRLLPNLRKINGQMRGEYLNGLKIPAAKP